LGGDVHLRDLPLFATRRSSDLVYAGNLLVVRASPACLAPIGQGRRRGGSHAGRARADVAGFPVETGRIDRPVRHPSRTVIGGVGVKVAVPLGEREGAKGAARGVVDRCYEVTVRPVAVELSRARAGWA